MNWKPIKDVPTGTNRQLLLYIPTRVEKWVVGYAHLIDSEISFTVNMSFLQSYERPTHYAELTTP